MGCDIHMLAQRRNESGGWDDLSFVPFKWRNYQVFAFLANVRNDRYNIMPISTPRGIPEDRKVKHDPEGWWDRTDDYYDDYHSHSWLLVSELTEFDYDNTYASYQCGSIEIPESYRDILGEGFFEDLEQLKYLDATRLVFSFDC